MKNVVFYRSDSGNEVVLNGIKKLSQNDRKIIGEDLRFVQMAYPVGLPHCRPLKDGLWEVRTSLPSGREYRLIFSYDSETETIIVLHGFIKKSQRTPPAEIDLAKGRRSKL